MKTIQDRSTKKKCALFVAISWLLARLWWGLEISRLTIFRVVPKAHIHYISRTHSILPPAHWAYARNRLYCVGFDEDEHALVIHELPPIGLN
ncbi:MAG: hypothetical protein ACE5KJ_08370 [Candidatus Zixiibacteriota bacterium]